MATIVLPVLALAALAAGASASAQVPELDYELRYEPPATGSQPARWCVRVRLSGAAPGRSLALDLRDWGDWQSAPDYIEESRSRPEPAPDSRPGHWRLVVGADGRAELEYRLRLARLGSPEQQRLGLLPTQASGYAFGYSWNTLARARLDGAALEGDARLQLRAPAGTPIVSGWAGRASGMQSTRAPLASGNAPLAFGEPAHEFVGSRAGLALELRQYGGGPDVLQTLAQVLGACAPAFEEAFGPAARRPYRAFVTDTQGGGMGSHYGLRIGVMPDTPIEQVQSPWLRGHIAHELMHDWLGLHLSARTQALVWFQEGFTEYLALWQVCATGLVERDWFARRLLELEQLLRANTGASSLAFADPARNWRDGDGPAESLAYTGAPLLALRVDAELRAAGQAGLPQLVRDLCARDTLEYGLEDLRTWFVEHGLEARWQASVLGCERPDVGASLELAGYESRRAPAELTYFGLRTDGAQPGCTVLAVDPEGPGAAAGIRPGDVLTGWFPARAEPALAPAPGDYPFGLGSFQPGLAGTYLGTRRADEERQVFVEPRRLPGAGYIVSRSSASEALDAFFHFEAH